MTTDFWTEAECQRLQRVAQEYGNEYLKAANGDTEQARKMLDQKTEQDKRASEIMRRAHICRVIHVASERRKG